MRLRLLLISTIFVSLLGYFGYHTIYGNRGIKSLGSLNNQIYNVTNELQQLRAERIELEHKVELLRSQSLDRDMLEEQAKKFLGVAKKNEEIFIIDEESTDQNQE